MSLVGRWEETKFPAGINLVQTIAPGWRQIESEVALDLITIPAVFALGKTGGDWSWRRRRRPEEKQRPSSRERMSSAEESDRLSVLHCRTLRLQGITLLRWEHFKLD